MRRFLCALVGVSVVNPEINKVEAELNKAAERHEEASRRFEKAVSGRHGFGVVLDFEGQRGA